MEFSNFYFTPSSGSGDVYAETTSQIEVLLSVPLASLALRVLDIASYATLMSYLPWDNWKEVAINLVKSVVNNPSKSQLSKVEYRFQSLFHFCASLHRNRYSMWSS